MTARNGTDAENACGAGRGRLVALLLSLTSFAAAVLFPLSAFQASHFAFASNCRAREWEQKGFLIIGSSAPSMLSAPRSRRFPPSTSAAHIEEPAGPRNVAIANGGLLVQAIHGELRRVGDGFARLEHFDRLGRRREAHLEGNRRRRATARERSSGWEADRHKPGALGRYTRRTSRSVMAAETTEQEQPHESGGGQNLFRF